MTLEVVPDWYRPRGSGPDLALLRVRGELDHPVACLSGAAEPDDRLWAYGYPDGAYRSGDPLTLTYEGSSQRSDGTELYKVAGSRVGGGFSGSPALNWRTGMVCGIIRLADNQPGGPPLARLIPAGVVLDTFAEVIPCAGGGSGGTWLNMLTDSQLRAAGSRYPGPWLRGYLTAICHVEEQRRAFGSNRDAPGLLDVYQSPRFRDATGGPVDVTSIGIGERDLLVVGDPGVGKSSLLRWLRHQAARRLLAGETVSYVPVLVRARDLTDQEPQSFPEAIASAVSKDLGRWLPDSPRPEIFKEDPLGETPWLLLVDGFEEILTSDERDKAIDPFAYWSGQPHLRLLITSRPLDEKEFRPLSEKGVSRSVLAPFDIEAVRRLATAWFGLLSGEDDAALRAENLIDGIERGQIKELARVPLITTMLCVLCAARGNYEIPQNRYDVYEQFTDVLLHKQLHEFGALPRLESLVQNYSSDPKVAQTLLDDRLSLLTAFALRQLKEDHPAARLADFALEWTAALRPSLFPEREWTTLVIDVLRQSGLVTGEDFWHRTIGDFLAARKAAQDPGAYEITPEQGTRLRYLLSNRSLLSFVAAGWARHHPDQVRSLCEILSRRPSPYLEFLATLVEDGVEVPPDILRRVTDSLATAANNPTRDPEVRVVSAAILTRLDRQRALPRLRVLALDPRTDASFRTAIFNQNLLNVDATRILMQEDPGSARDVLVVQAGDPARSPERRLEAARRLLQFDPAAGAAALEKLADTPSVPKETRLESLRELARRDAARSIEVGRRLAGDAELATDAALAVSEFAPDLAADALATLVQDASTAIPDRTRAALRSAQLRPENNEPSMILVSLASDSSVPPADRLQSASALAEIDTRDSLPLLRSLVSDRSADMSTRVRAETMLLRLHPEQATPALADLADLGDLGETEPHLAADLFAAWAATSTQEYVPALASYLRTMDKGPGIKDLSRAHSSFDDLAGFLRQANPVRCAAEMDKIIHEPGWGTFRRQAEELWAELEPERCADHLVAVVRGQCQQRGEADDVREFFGASAERGQALLSLARLGDERVAALADAILLTLGPGSGHPVPEFCLYAARAIAERNRERGVNLMAEMALDNRLDGSDRLRCALELMWHDEDRAAKIFSVLARDRVVQQSAGILGSGLPNMADMADSSDILAERIEDIGAARGSREVAIQELLRLDPARTLGIMMTLAEAADQEERQWALRRLSKALHDLEVTVPGYDR